MVTTASEKPEFEETKVAIFDGSSVWVVVKFGNLGIGGMKAARICFNSSRPGYVSRSSHICNQHMFSQSLTTQTWKNVIRAVKVGSSSMIVVCKGAAKVM